MDKIKMARAALDPIEGLIKGQQWDKVCSLLECHFWKAENERTLEPFLVMVSPGKDYPLQASSGSEWWSRHH